MAVEERVYKLFSQRDTEAMSMLVEAYKNELYNLCYRLTLNRQDADDLFQQTWLRAFCGASGYKNDAFGPWLYRICVNQYRDNYRRMARRKKLQRDDFESTSAKDFVLTNAAGGESPEEQFEKRHIQALLVANIDKLPESQKVPVVLFYYQQMKYSDIATVLKIPEGTVKSRISTAKRRLRSVLEGELYV